MFLFLKGDLLNACGSGVEKWMDGDGDCCLVLACRSLGAGDEGASISGLEPHLYFWHRPQVEARDNEHHFTSSVVVSNAKCLSTDFVSRFTLRIVGRCVNHFSEHICCLRSFL